MNFKHKYLFLLPGFLVLLGILIFPIGFTVRLSLSSWDSFFPGLDFIGLENYTRLFTDDPRFWEAFQRLSFMSVITVFLQYTIGFALAHMVWKEIKFQRFFRVLFLIPMMTTPVIMTVIWKTVFHESLGPVNDFFSLFGVTPLWLSSEALSKVTVIIVEVWQWTPFMFLLLLAGLLSLPKEPFLAASIDGASDMVAFWRIIFPMMRPITATVAIINALWIWNDFLLPRLVLTNETQTLPLSTYLFYGQYSIEYGQAMAGLVLAVIPIVIFYLVLQKQFISGISQGAVK